MEADPTYWTLPSEVQSRLCAVRINLDKTSTILLSKVEYRMEEEGEYLIADIFPQRLKQVGTFKVSPRREREIQLDDIVAVCVLLVRQ